VADWTWCNHTRDHFSAVKADTRAGILAVPAMRCTGCGQLLEFPLRTMIHWGEKHYHLECALDKLGSPPPEQPMWPFGG